MAKRQYSDEEVREILRVAIEREENDPAGLAREDVVRAASEVGISEASIDRAIVEIEREREIATEVAAIKMERRRALLSHASTWAIVNAMLFGIDWMSGPGYWFYYPLFGWGIAVALQARSTLLANPARARATALKRIGKRARRREKEARRARQKQVEKELEEAVEQGVAAVLGAAERVAQSLDGGKRPRRRVTRSRSRVAEDLPEEEDLDDEDPPPRRRHRR